VPFQTFDTLCGKTMATLADRGPPLSSAWPKVCAYRASRSRTVDLCGCSNGTDRRSSSSSGSARNGHTTGNPFEIDGAFFVAHAEHLDASFLYRWDGAQLQPHQVLSERGGMSLRDL